MPNMKPWSSAGASSLGENRYIGTAMMHWDTASGGVRIAAMMFSLLIRTLVPTTVIMRFTLPKVPFTVPLSPRTGGYEYVWHCHILEHEEHDMMRPFAVRVRI